MTSLTEIVRAADDHELEWLCQTHRDHVRSDELTKTNASVKSFGNNVDEVRACDDLHLDFGIGLTERSDHRLQQDWHDGARDRKAQQPGCPLTEATGHLTGRDQFRK